MEDERNVCWSVRRSVWHSLYFHWLCCGCSLSVGLRSSIGVGWWEVFVSILRLLFRLLFVCWFGFELYLFCVASVQGCLDMITVNYGDNNEFLRMTSTIYWYDDSVREGFVIALDGLSIRNEVMHFDAKRARVKTFGAVWFGDIQWRPSAKRINSDVVLVSLSFNKYFSCRLRLCLLVPSFVSFTLARVHSIFGIVCVCVCFYCP